MKTEGITRIAWAALVVLVMCGYSFAEQTIYVDDDGPADFNNIQAAIDDSSDGDIIIVADGTYTGAGNREISFRGKAITVHSENGTENCIIDCQGKGIGFLFRDGEDVNSILDGLTITNGYSSGCGALYIDSYSSPMIINCKFENNHAGGQGGAINCHSNYSPKLTNCIFTGNSSRYGGGIFISEGSPILTNCTFSGNSAVSWGGAVHCEEISTPTIRNCLIIGNKTEWKGGGISITDGSDAIIENCTISDNIANDEGGGIYTDYRTTVSNSILWDNSPDQITPNYRLVINHSDVQGGWPGLDNIDVDPLFVDPGYWDANGLWIDGDYHLLEDSPCIDAGDNAAVTVATDLDGNARILNGLVDMGAYEFPAPGQLRELYVDDDAAGANDGSSWADAYNYLQDALAFACSGDEIHIAEGIYTPDRNSANPNGSGDRSATFQLINGITLKGGYAGFGEPDPNARDIEEYETILSGDLDGNDVAVNDPCDLLNEPTRAENSYHVVMSTRTGETTLLDGFTVTGGNSNGHSSNYFGGGMYNRDSSLMITNCTFGGNSACEGGGMYNTAYCIATLTNCTFIDNFAYDGGAMSNWESNPTLTNCRFSGNSAKWLAGGMCNDCKSCPILDNCTFSGNSANYYAGLHNDNDSYPTLTNCIFWDSRASGDMVQVGDFTIANYSCIQGGWPGEGNIDADPCFVDEANGDYHLLPDSPCIDSGNPNYIVGPNETDLDGKPRIINDRIDMGAYEAGITYHYHVDGVSGDNTNDGLTRETAFKTIQRGINVAEDYDTVLVWPGVYHEEVALWGDAITVKSAADAAIVETDYGYAFSFFSAEGPDTVLSNFIIRNSQYGIYLINGASPTLRNLTIVDNDFGISAFNGADPDISNCIFWGNYYGDLFREPVPLEAKYSWIQDEVDEPIAHWKFDEGSGTTAYDSAGTNDGTIYGATWTNGQLGSALDFDGLNDYVDMADTVKNYLDTSYTVSAWIKVHTISLNKMISAYRNSTDGNPVLFQITQYNEDIGFTVRDNSLNTAYADYTNTLRTNTWYHIAGVREGNMLNIYVNGVRGTQGSGTIGTISPDNLKIGAVQFAGNPLSSYFNGTIDEVAIYNVALSTEEVQAIYQLGLAGLSYGEPGFVDANNGDYHLLSERGRYWPAHDVWVLDGATSSCIDGGDPAVDPSNERMPNGGRINMGAYGNTAYASMSECWSKADFNCDGVVDFKDFAIMAAGWLDEADWIE